MDTVEMAPAGLKGVPVVRTELGSVRGTEGFFHYRQHDACGLARDHDVETVWRVLLDGGGPQDAAAQAAFRAELQAFRRLPDAVAAMVRGLPRGVAPLDGARALLAGLRGVAPEPALLDQTPRERRRTALRLGVLWPLLVGAVWRHGQGLAPLSTTPPDGLDHSGVALWALRGEVAPDAARRALDTYLCLTVDHGLNASTFAARVVASTGADLTSCLLAGLSALSGPLHGGAPSRVLEMLDAIGAPDRAADFARRELAAGRRLMGFGHAVYRTTDPRSDLLRGVAQQLAPERAAQAIAIEQTLLGALRAAKPDRVLATNVEYYAAIVLEGCGLSAELCTPMFACARAIGWGAHALEQAALGVLFRPKAHYDGPAVGR